MQVPIESQRPRRRWAWPIAIFVAIAVLGVFYAKWEPYYFKAFSAAATHTLGKSIVTGSASHAPAVGFQAALSYTVGYFKDIWIALVVGLLVGAGVQTLLPASWLYRVLGRISPKSRALAVAAAVPSMMCTCCSAPIAVSMKKKNLSTGATLAYWLGNPVLNPATIIFMGFVLGWNWALLRIAMGLVLVFGVSWLGDRWMTRGAKLESDALPDVTPPQDEPATFGRFFGTLGRLVVGLVPEYIVIVAILGAVRAWLFPAMSPSIGHALWLMVALAIFGTLFVIPTAGEIPIIQTLMQYGLGLGAGGTLMLALPAVSLPSMAMVGQQLGAKTMVKVAGLVAVAAFITGLLAIWLL
ncbi:permease [Sulfobacillus harzensis]|uniref:Permease n=1 Tax=Sulfobacillus harzensis TaxID=2729629 RepID=A0A7Y0Q3M9_9FIRM|nr:permease [Sulfobacillus harzensis]NMP22339.1 permease [Sulfobacillus harzensis]